MNFQKTVAAAACSVLLFVSVAVGLPVFTVTGAFSSPQAGTLLSGSNTVATSNGISIAFTGNTESLTLDPTGLAASTFSHANFGMFSITGVPTSGISATLLADFTMTLTQTGPGGGSQVFGVGSISGEIYAGASNAFIQFAIPLALTFTGTGNAYTYSIISADTNNPGRIAMNNPGSTTTVQGRVAVTAVPLQAAAPGAACLLTGLCITRRRQTLR